MLNSQVVAVNLMDRIKAVWFTREALLCWLPPTVLGVVLRFWSLGFGLPNHFRPDEDMVVLPSLGMVGGNLDPYDYTYPTLYKYILVLIYRVCMALGWGAEGYESAWEYAAYGFFVDGSFFFLVARGVSAVFGVICVLAIYRVGELCYGRWVGSVSAWLLSVSVLHVRDSHFGVTDMTSVSLFMLSIVYCIYVALRGETKDYVIAGVLVGLASSAKYGSVVGLVALGVAHLVRCPGGVPMLSQWVWNKKGWLAGLVCVVAFIVTSPFVLLKSQEYALYFAAQMRHVYDHGHGVDLGPGWLYHPTVTLRYGLGICVLLGSLGGLIVAIMRRSRVDWVLLGVFVALCVMTGRGRAVFFRYALPLLPFGCVFCAVLLDRVRSWSLISVRYTQAIGIVLVGLCLAEPLYGSVRLNSLLGKPDTRAQARKWIETHVLEGLLIANIGGVYGDVTLRNRHSMPWWLWRYVRKFEEVESTALSGFLSQFEAKLPAHYSYKFVPGLENLEEQSRGLVGLLDRPEISIVITHEHPLHYSTVASPFKEALQNRATLLTEFLPGEVDDLASATFDLQDAFYYPLGNWGQLQSGGPVVRIWEIDGHHYSIYPDARNQRILLRDAFLWMGNALVKQGAEQQARSAFEQALKIDPNFDLAQEQLKALK